MVLILFQFIIYLSSSRFRGEPSKRVQIVILLNFTTIYVYTCIYNIIYIILVIQIMLRFRVSLAISIEASRVVLDFRLTSSFVTNIINIMQILKLNELMN